MSALIGGLGGILRPYCAPFALLFAPRMAGVGEAPFASNGFAPGVFGTTGKKTEGGGATGKKTEGGGAPGAIGDFSIGLSSMRW